MERYSLSLVTTEMETKPQRDTRTATVLAVFYVLNFLTFNNVHCWQERGAAGIPISSGCERTQAQPQLALFRKIEDLHIHDLVILLLGVSLERPTHVSIRSAYGNFQL